MLGPGFAGNITLRTSNHEDVLNLFDIRNAIPFIHDNSNHQYTCCPIVLWMIRQFTNGKVAGSADSSRLENLSRYLLVFQYFWCRVNVYCTCKNLKCAIFVHFSVSPPRGTNCHSAFLNQMI